MTGGLFTGGDSLDINVDHREERAFVRWHGRLEVDFSPTPCDRPLAILQGQPPKTIIVDLTAFSYVDPSGIVTLREALKVARNREATLFLKGLQGRVARFFEVTDLLAVFEMTACEGGSPECGELMANCSGRCR